MAVLDHHHPGLSDKVNSLYTLSEAWCTSESDRDFGALERAVSDMSPEDLILCVYFFFFFFYETGERERARLCGHALSRPTIARTGCVLRWQSQALAYIGPRRNA